MKEASMKVEIEFTEPLLGTLAGNPEIAKEFIASKHPSGEPQSDEVEAMETAEEAIEKAATIFPRIDGKPFLWDYQIKGWCKAAVLATHIESGAYTQEQLKKLRLTMYMHKRTIDKMVFVFPRQIILISPDGFEKTGWLQRPLRGQTMKGERISLAISETMPVGTKAQFEFRWLNDKLKEPLLEWLDYGKLYGLLQWRNASYGRFNWRDITEK